MISRAIGGHMERPKKSHKSRSKLKQKGVTKASPPWRNYEEVAQYLLNALAVHFDLGRVEGKQIVPGKSGAEWELDAKGVLVDGEAFVVIECRRYTTSKVKQDAIGSLVTKIKDTGARGGIIVTAIGLQSGAKKLAEHHGIKQVKLDASSSTTDYILGFLKQIFLGASENVSLQDSAELEIIRDGKVVERHRTE
jgi:Restriction endonuclease